MISTWILIIILNGVGTRDKGALDHVEFNDKQACQVAQVVVQQVRFEHGNIVAFCFPKDSKKESM